MKVTPLTGWTGVYRDSRNNAVDVRPREGCPCFNELKKKEVGELAKMLAKALTNQISALESSENFDANLMKLLRKHKEKILKAYNNLLEKKDE